MDDLSARRRVRPSSMAPFAPHRSLVSDPGRQTGSACLAAWLPERGKPRVRAWRATDKASRLLGDIDPDRRLDHLVACARIPAPMSTARDGAVR